MDPTIPWKTLKVLSFDVYGTIVDQNKGITTAIRGTSINPFLPIDDSELLRSIAKYSSELEQGSPSMRKSEINAKCLLRYISDLDLVESGRVPKEEVQRAAEEFGRKMGTYPAFADSVPALKRLAKHYKLIALSNVDHSSFKITLTEQLGGNPFDAHYIAEDIGSYKPNLNNFKYLLDHMREDFDVGQDQLCHVAQSLPVDHSATKPMGIRSVWVDRYDILGDSGRSAEDMQGSYGYKLRVGSLGELADVVDRAFADAGGEE